MAVTDHRRLIRRSKIDTVKKGRRWWISTNSISRYVEARQASTDEPGHSPAGPKRPAAQRRESP